MKLSDWMDRSGVKPAQLAATCGVHAITIYKWRAGSSFPRPAQLAALAQATGGAVTSNDFLNAPTTSQPARSAGFAEAQAPFVQEARSLGLDADAIAAAALKQAIGDEKARRWNEEHREAFAAWDRWVEENGLPLEEHRMF